MARQVSDVADVARDFDAVADGFDALPFGDACYQTRPQNWSTGSGEDCVLDVGCGTGKFLRELRGRMRIGVDVSMGMLLKARQCGEKDLPALHLVLANAESLPFRDGVFAQVTAQNSLHHARSFSHAFLESCRVLRGGGSLAVRDITARRVTGSVPILGWLLLVITAAVRQLVFQPSASLGWLKTALNPRWLRHQLAERFISTVEIEALTSHGFEDALVEYRVVECGWTEYVQIRWVKPDARSR